MTALLTLLVFSSFMYWFWKRFAIERKRSFTGLILLFLLASLMSFMLSLFAQHDYLDGLAALIVSGASVSAFWISTTVIIIWKNSKEKTNSRMAMDLIQALPLLVVPLLLWLMISQMSFKIGG